MRLSLPSLALAALVTVPLGQERVKPDEPVAFPQVLDAAQEAWESGRYGACMGALNNALGLAMEKRVGLIAAALPPAPAGWALELEDVGRQARGNPVAASLLVTVGSLVSARYREEGGQGQVDVSIHADSPVAQILGVLVADPALLDEGSELIEYEQHRAILTTADGSPRQLQVLLHDKHLCDVDVRDLGEEQLFALFDQAAIDRLAAALER
jgi:hypothetical protein